MAPKQAIRMTWPRKIGVLIETVANVLAGGDADETVSARAFRLSQRNRAWAAARQVIDALFYWDAVIVGGRTIGHCEQAYILELVRGHYRNHGVRLEQILESNIL